MALLLRMGGVPARVATGFSPGGYSKRKQAWIVRDTDAHSWVEAWFDDYGWVTLDPTPSDTPARSQIATLAAPADGRGVGRQPGRRPERRRRHARPTGARPARARSSSTSCAAAAGRRPRTAAAAGGSGLPLWPLIPVALVLSRGRRAVARAAPARAPGRPARPGDLRARDRAAALRPPDAGGHDAAPARAPARPVRRRGRLPARGQRRALRAAAARADDASSAGRCAASSRPAWASPAACAPSGRCRQGA